MRAKRGFTLIELLVVIAIIGVLSSVVLASLAGARQSARTARSLQDLNAIRTALELYASSNNGYPPVSGWSGFQTCWGGSSGANWIPGLTPAHIPSLPLAPVSPQSCNNEYIYYSDGANYKLIWHGAENMSTVAQKYPQLIDPIRSTYSYGFWTPGAAAW